MSATLRLWRQAPLWRVSLYLGVLAGTSFLVFPPAAPPRAPAPRAAGKVDVNPAVAFQPSATSIDRPLSDADRAAIEKAAVDKVLAERAAAEKALLDRAAADKANAVAAAVAAERIAVAKAAQAAAAPPPAATPAPRTGSAAPVPQPGGSQAGAGLVQPDTSLAPQTPAGRTGGYGSKHRVSYTIESREIPLPHGEFRVVGIARQTFGAAEGSYAALVNIEAGLLKAIVVVIATPPAAKMAAGLRGYSECNRTDLLHLVKQSNQDFGNQDCYYVNHVMPDAWRNSASNPQSKWIITDLDLQKLPVPPSLIVNTYHFATQDAFLRVSYYFNPEARGIASRRAALWNDSDWSRNYLAQDSKKLDYIETTKDWAAAMYPFLRGTFEGKTGNTPSAKLLTTLP